METFSTMLFRLPDTEGEFMPNGKTSFAELSRVQRDVLDMNFVSLRGILSVRIFSFFGEGINFANKFSTI
jgi:hypothetical protein